MTDEPQRSRVDLGRANRRSVLAEILYHAPIARTEIANNTGLTGASVSRITRDLINSGLVVESSTSLPQNRSGRRFVQLKLNANGAYVIGLSINAFSQWVTICGLDNQVIAQQELGLESVDDPHFVLEQVINCTLELLEAHDIDQQKVIGGGVAIGGAVEPRSGKLLFSTTMDWGEIEIAAIMSERLNFPVCIETIPNALNLAETRFGIAKGHKNVVMINASLRMGASLLIDNQIRRGVKNSAGLIGHLKLQNAQPSPDQPQHLNEIAGGIAVLKQLSDTTYYSGKHAAAELLSLKQRCIQGEAEASAAFQKAGQMLSQTIEVIDILLQPDVILLAGPMASVPTYIEGALESFQEEDKSRILLATINPGQAAVYLAFNEFLANRDIDLKAFGQ